MTGPLVNPYRGTGIAGIAGDLDLDPAPVRTLLALCPVASPTPLVPLPALAEEIGVAEVWVKDERHRMGLGSFKALGAAYVVARHAQDASLAGVTYTAASAGNHGLSLATGAALFGARSVVFISETVPSSFAARLEEAGAEVVREGPDYEASMAAAAEAARVHGWRLLSDSSWDGYTDIPRMVMQGYSVMASEIVEGLHSPPVSHVFVQAGVGGMAAVVAGTARAAWGDGPTIAVVEPAHGRPLMESIRAGRPVRADGPPSVMGRLDCKEPSLLALGALARSADLFVTVDDALAGHAAGMLAGWGLATTPSGAAGVAALVSGVDAGLDGASRVLVVVSEGPEDPDELGTVP